MRILFVHVSFPGQFRHLAQSLAHAGNEVVALAERGKFDREAKLPGVKVGWYDFQPAARELNIVTCIRRGRAVANAARQLERIGFKPDVIWAHISWGVATFVKDVFPDAKLLLYCEYYYLFEGAEAGFDPEYRDETHDRLKMREINAPSLVALEAADRGVAPTTWQRSLFPSAYASRIEVLHDGIDTDRARPDPSARFVVPGTDVVLSAGEEVVTFVARNLEPVRGFHIFMRSIPEIQRRRPSAHIVILGGDSVLYGAAPSASAPTMRERLLRELHGRVDLSRVYMPGFVSYTDYLCLLQVSSVHVYLTYPFILSWSMLEAMAAGCVVVGSKTPPVEEVIRHGENGFLVDFFSPEALADQVVSALEKRNELQHIRDAARRTVVERYDLKRVCLPAQVELIEDVMAK